MSERKVSPLLESEMCKANENECEDCALIRTRAERDEALVLAARRLSAWDEDRHSLLNKLAAAEDYWTRNSGAEKARLAAEEAKDFTLDAAQQREAGWALEKSLLVAKLAAAEASRNACWAEMQREQDEKKVALATRDALGEALGRYGSHASGCMYERGADRCNCGFLVALARWEKGRGG